jgi:ankyrin repeat protein
VAQLLIGSGGVSAVDWSGWTPLHHAVHLDHEALAQLLVDNDASVSAVDKVGWTPLHLAANNGAVGTSQLLVDGGVDKGARDQSGNTALHIAARKDHAEVVKLLIRDTIDINEGNGNGLTALCLAISSGSLRIVQMLSESGANLNLFDRYYGCPLQIAVVNGHTDMVEILLRAGATEYVDEHGWCPTLCARESGNRKMIEMFPTTRVEDSSLTEFHQPTSWSNKHKWHRLALTNDGLDVRHHGGIANLVPFISSALLTLLHRGFSHWQNFRAGFSTSKPSYPSWRH